MQQYATIWVVSVEQADPWTADDFAGDGLSTDEVSALIDQPRPYRVKVRIGECEPPPATPVIFDGRTVMVPIPEDIRAQLPSARPADLGLIMLPEMVDDLHDADEQEP